MLHYVLKAEFVALASLKVLSGVAKSGLTKKEGKKIQITGVFDLYH